jgi:hypothetical protein
MVPASVKQFLQMSCNWLVEAHVGAVWIVREIAGLPRNPVVCGAATELQNSYFAYMAKA